MYSKWPQVGEPSLHPPPTPKFACAPSCTIHPPPVRKSHGGVEAITVAGLATNTAIVAATSSPTVTSPYASRAMVLSPLFIVLSPSNQAALLVARKYRPTQTRLPYQQFQLQ